MNPELLAQLSNIGLILFLFLYLYASTIYDGGSKLYPEKKKWDWINNYWCDLIWPLTILEKPNRASKWGITANFILCLSCILFFNAYPIAFTSGNYWTYLISISGTMAMLCAMEILRFASSICLVSARKRQRFELMKVGTLRELEQDLISARKEQVKILDV